MEVRKVNKTKRNIIIAAVALCICAAAYLNWSYNNQSGGADAFADASLAAAKSAEETSADSYMSEYFAEARLKRQQSRDEAMKLLEQASTAQTASQETIDGAMNSIAAMASYSMQETQIENLILAKSFTDCVAFMSEEGITLAVPAPETGLTPEDVARITECILSETDYTASQLRIIEVKKPTAEQGQQTDVPESAAPGDASAAEQPEDASTVELPEEDTTFNDDVIE